MENRRPLPERDAPSVFTHAIATCFVVVDGTTTPAGGRQQRS
jgi:hypothetical protein